MLDTMAKIIFTSRYMRDAPPIQLENYVRYIGTREGVEKVDESKLKLPATKQQKNLISQLIRDIPQAKEMLEYTDFLLQPTIGNASEFISCALEQHVALIAKRENYVDYIANRPRVERVGEHGLFTDRGKAIVLRQVQEEVKNHKGVIWTHVISLRREDAARLGYDRAEQWMALLRSKRAMLCKHMKIDSANLRWYAAFHNESHHPHVHLLVYSAKDNDGYLTKQSIDAMRSEFAHDIFRQDFAHIYEEQNQSRSALKSGAADILQQMMNDLSSGTMINPVIEEKMVQLSKRLKNTTGKKVYGYLKRDVKNLIDEIVDELAKDSRVDTLYQAWGKWQNEILLTYQNQVSSLPPLSKQPQFKSIKNMVIQEALKLGKQEFTFEDEWITEHTKELEGVMFNSLPITEMMTEQQEWYLEERNERRKDTIFWWNETYKQAREYFYGSDKIQQDFTKARYLLEQEAENGNGFAMYDLGRIYADGLGCEIRLELSKKWYGKALETFLATEPMVRENQRTYLWYRIGKMYAAGLGTEKKYDRAVEWFEKAVSKQHKYAQYSLGMLYARGQGVAQNHKKALELYECSAVQGNPYAEYEVAMMYQNGIGTKVQREVAQQSFRTAFLGFCSLEKKSHDDKLQYRLGHMIHTGTGTERNTELAAKYWEQSAKLGNIYAQYALAKLWIENGNGDRKQALEWMNKSADGGHAVAQYMLGKLYLLGRDVIQDIEKAVYYFKQSAEQNNEYAAYQLGKLYLLGEYVQKDIESAVRYFERAVAKGNPYAGYVLGKLYLQGKDIPYDKEKALKYLTESANQGNVYAKFLIEHLNVVRDPSVFMVATRLLQRLEDLFREDYRKAQGGNPYYIDRKRRRKLMEKKQAQGQKQDDQEPVQQL